MASWDAVQAAIPAVGSQLLLQSDAETVVVYQAFDEGVGSHAVKTGHFGGRAWRMDRRSAVRTSLPDVLHRANWGERKGKEWILAIRLRRSGFDQLLRQAIHRTFPPGLYESKRSWELATRYSQVSWEWAPDRDLQGNVLGRLAGRLGMRDAALANFATVWIEEIVDLSDWARQSRGAADLEVPTSAPYEMTDVALLERLSHSEHVAGQA